jgi:hypothetical protein
MQGYLQWKVVPPDYNNPFKPPVSEDVLVELVRRRNSLKRVCKLKCLCEGFELMTFDNLENPSMFTEHPCITAMGMNAVMNYMSQSDVESLIEDQLERIEQDIRGLLDERTRNFDPQAISWDDTMTIKEIRRRRERGMKQVQMASGSYRVRYENRASA